MGREDDDVGKGFGSGYVPVSWFPNGEISMEKATATTYGVPDLGRRANGHFRRELVFQTSKIEEK